MARRNEGVPFVATLGALTGVSATAVDISIPAQPAIVHEFAVEPGLGTWIVSAYFIGFGFGQFIWGPVSDRYGRLIPLYVALGAFLVTSLICAMTRSFEMLIFARMLQGLAGGGPPVIARAIARDQGGGVRSASLIATMTVILGGAPLLAPVIGSALLTLFEWRALFWALVLFAIANTAAAAMTIPESLPPGRRHPLSVGRMAGNASRLLRTGEFLAGVSISSMIFVGYTALLGMGAEVAEAIYDIEGGAYGPLFALAASAFVLGSVLTRGMVPKVGVERVLNVGATIAAVSGLAFIALSVGDPGLAVLWAGMVVYCLAFGMLLPAATAKALEPAGDIAGFGSSLIAILQTFAGVGGAVLAGVMFAGTHHSLTIVMAVGGLGAGLARVIGLVLVGKSDRTDGKGA